METDLSRIKCLSEKKEDENWGFRDFLKGFDMPLKKMDRIVHRLYKQISSQIDCTKCANCCREIQIGLYKKDTENFSKGLGISAEQFRKRYLAKGEETGEFIFKKKPCPFLKNNLCSHYNYRPKACRSYPHLHKNDFVFRLIGVIQNSSVCPIVFNVYEYLKAELWPTNDFD